MAVRPLYIIFAGVNGAGKTTLYHTRMWSHDDSVKTLPRVNPDEILRERGWSWADHASQVRAGKEAVRRIRGYLEKRESFNQETTLTGNSIARYIRIAHECGYRIVMFYIGVEDPTIANERIAHRASRGGHSIDPETVNRRFSASLANLVRLIDACDEVYLYDNTQHMELEARFESGELAYMNPMSPALPWIDRILGQLGYEEIAW